MWLSWLLALLLFFDSLSGRGINARSKSWKRSSWRASLPRWLFHCFYLYFSFNLLLVTCFVFCLCFRWRELSRRRKMRSCWMSCVGEEININLQGPCFSSDDFRFVLFSEVYFSSVIIFFWLNRASILSSVVEALRGLWRKAKDWVLFQRSSCPSLLYYTNLGIKKRSHRLLREKLDVAM